jgi:hypothetical protein
MLQNIINSFAIAFTVATTAGVLVHDTQIDRATTVALALPAAVASLAAVDSAIKSGDAHVHVERVSLNHALRASVPRLQPRDDDRRYVQTKRMSLNVGDNSVIWPSV